MMGLGGFLGFLLIGMIVWAIIQHSNNNSSSYPIISIRQRSPADKENALDILKKRYARGEISQEEYGEIKEKIS